MEMREMEKARKPYWLKKSLPRSRTFGRTKCLLDSEGLHTVCEEARCPNRWECFASSTATFLIMGPNCTRRCRFCSVSKSAPVPLDPTEPRRLAKSVKKMGLEYVVITSVTRDDIPDGGALHFVEVISAIRNTMPYALVEVLVPDFKGSSYSLSRVLESGIAVLNHNVETVPSLYSMVRPGADYMLSLNLLRISKDIAPHIPTKSGLMVGLGEDISEIENTLRDLKDAGCDVVTIGQYLQPTKENMPVERYYTPEEFSYLESFARDIGFKVAMAGPFVRSSFKAGDIYQKIRQKKEKNYEDRVPKGD